MENLKSVILHSLFFNCSQIISPAGKTGLIFYFPTPHEKNEFVKRVKTIELINYQFIEYGNHAKIVHIY